MRRRVVAAAAVALTQRRFRIILNIGAALWPFLKTGGNVMSWKTPKIVEIALGMEINCYACAEVK
ncbi:pyrroloquinoline quinone precursor peptide PqqA [Nitrospirillum sp. BR 11163]|uniref:pyrroloquinoline quinone precursor peptide PqqA n=1 Tax=Nitrospirillum sp. BR 11163 TaxID=3104323 RepID=UPI003A4C6B30